MCVNRGLDESLIGILDRFLFDVNYHNIELYDLLRLHRVFDFIVGTGALKIIHANVVKRRLI